MEMIVSILLILLSRNRKHNEKQNNRYKKVRDLFEQH